MFSAALPYLVGGALGAVGGAFDFFGQRSANTSTAASAKEQMDFQERMSNSSWQRAVIDMKKAGLNPMLAYTQGGANVPSGASSTYANELQGAGGAVSRGLSSAYQAKMLDLELRKAEQDIDTSRQQGNMYGQQANLNQVLMNNAVINGTLLENQVPGSMLERQIDEGRFGTALAYARRLGLDFNSAMSLVSILRGRPKPFTSTTEESSPYTGEIHRRTSTSYSR